jgi:5'-3' exonuclease
VDAAHVFVRAYCGYPTMSSHGYQMGGAVGFLKTLQRLVREIQPRRVYVCWEGGGSARRRSLYPEYKRRRRPVKMNRFYGDDIPDSDENKQHQIIACLDFLKSAPVFQLYAQDCEGDDIISYLCRGRFRNDDKVIISSDKDLYQLLDKHTHQYSLHKKALMTAENVLEESRVASHNFAVAKALCGDPGDNVPGIKGIGWGKVHKLFPMLGLPDDVLIQDVINYCKAHQERSSLYRRVVEKELDLRRNWKLLYLDGSMLSNQQAKRIDHIIETAKPKSSKVGLMQSMAKEGVNTFDIDTFFHDLRCVEK